MHKIQGIGAGFIPSTYNTQVVDKIIRVKDDDAIRTGRELSLQEGLLVGISSGAATFAALQLSQMPEYKDKKHRRIAARYRRTIFINRTLCL